MQLCLKSLLSIFCSSAVFFTYVLYKNEQIELSGPHYPTLYHAAQLGRMKTYNSCSNKQNGVCVGGFLERNLEGQVGLKPLVLEVFEVHSVTKG